ncbi:MAG: hypothetical protein IJ222_10285 [Bacteroidales bacterium]|nr:hypothetical protein [Bacteroidales bacterium]
MKKLLSYLVLALVLMLGAGACKENLQERINREADCAWQLLRSGDDAEAMQTFLQMADDCHAKGDFDKEATALYCAAQIYLQQRDTAGMQKVLEKMEALAGAHPDGANVTYSYHSVLQTLYAIQFEENGDEENRDKMLVEGAVAINSLEKMSLEECNHHQINPVWNYYNMAVAYDMYFDPPVRDSIAYYLEKAREANRQDYTFAENVRLEGDISIGDEQAWLYYHDGAYRKAEEEMFRVLSLIDSVEIKTPNTVRTERSEAYAFLVELYSSTGRAEEALKYEQLKAQTDLDRLGVERNEAVHKVQAQYDVAKAEAKVARLRAALATSGGIILVLALTMLALFLWRKNRLEQQYSQAVEALVETDSAVKALTGTVPLEQANHIFSSALKPLSAVERKYILLFMSGKSTDEIADAMHVAPASVYTMKYRIKKKFPESFPLPF